MATESTARRPFESSAGTSNARSSTDRIEHAAMLCDTYLRHLGAFVGYLLAPHPLEETIAAVDILTSAGVRLATSVKGLEAEAEDLAPRLEMTAAGVEETAHVLSLRAHDLDTSFTSPLVKTIMRPKDVGDLLIAATTCSRVATGVSRMLQPKGNSQGLSPSFGIAGMRMSSCRHDNDNDDNKFDGGALGSCVGSSALQCSSLQPTSQSPCDPTCDGESSAGHRSQESNPTWSIAQSSSHRELHSACSSAGSLSLNEAGDVVSGSLQTLVRCLTRLDPAPDKAFCSTFLLTFRLFCVPAQLAGLLVRIFHDAELAGCRRVPTQLRVGCAFKLWLQSFWIDDADHEAYRTIKSFCKHIMKPTLPGLSRELLRMLKVISENRHKSQAPEMTSRVSTDLKPADLGALGAIDSRRGLGHMKFILHQESVHLAQQLTLRQMTKYCAILPTELLGSRWMKGAHVAANVAAVTSLSTSLSQLVTECILQSNTAQRRASRIEQWISVATYCVYIRNYEGAMAIVGGLSCSAINRLHNSWALVNDDHTAAWQSLRSMAMSIMNCIGLRAAIRDHDPPCLPFLGPLLTELALIDEGNPDMRSSRSTTPSDEGHGSLVNFAKHTRSANTIKLIRKFQVPYRIEEDTRLQHSITTTMARIRQYYLDDHSGDANFQIFQYKRSLMLEPRNQPLQP